MFSSCLPAAVLLAIHYSGPLVRWPLRAIPIAHCKLQIIQFLPSKFLSSNFPHFIFLPLESHISHFSFEFLHCVSGLPIQVLIFKLNIQHPITGRRQCPPVKQFKRVKIDKKSTLYKIQQPIRSGVVNGVYKTLLYALQ